MLELEIILGSLLFSSVAGIALSAVDADMIEDLAEYRFNKLGLYCFFQSPCRNRDFLHNLDQLYNVGDTYANIKLQCVRSHEM